MLFRSINSRIIRFRKQFKIAARNYIIAEYIRKAGMGSIEIFVKPSDERVRRYKRMVAVHSGYFHREWVFFDAVVVIKPRKSAPANVER